MRNLLFSLSAFQALIFICCISTGCHSNVYEDEASAFLAKAEELQSRHTRLENEIDSLWDYTTLKLALGLPKDIPPMDREIFLKSRNADHIRMFMSFDKLDTSLKQLVNEAGEYDQILASRIRILSNERLAFEKEKILFLQKLKQQKGEAACRKVTEQLQEIAYSNS